MHVLRMRETIFLSNIFDCKVLKTSLRASNKLSPFFIYFYYVTSGLRTLAIMSATSFLFRSQLGTKTWKIFETIRFCLQARESKDIRRLPKSFLFTSISPSMTRFRKLKKHRWGCLITRRVAGRLLDFFIPVMISLDFSKLINTSIIYIFLKPFYAE